MGYLIQVSKGTLVAHFISALTPFIIASFFDPEEIGVLALYTSIVSFIASFAGLDFFSAINVSKSEEDVPSLFTLSCIISIFSTTILLVVYGLSFLFQEIVPYDIYSSSVLFLYPWAIFFSLHFALIESFARLKMFNFLGRNQILRAGISSSLQITSGLLGFGVVALLASRVIGEVVSFLYSYKKLKFPLKKEMDINKLKRTFKKFKSYSFHITPTRIMLTLGKNGPIFIITGFYSLKEVGWFTLASKAVSLSSSIIAENIQKVFESRSTSYKEEDLQGFYQKTLILSLCFAIAMSIPLYLISLYSDSLPISSKWIKAFSFIPPLLPIVFGNFINALNYSTLKRLESLKALRNFTIVENILIFGAMLAFASKKTDVLILTLIYSASTLSLALLKASYTFRELKKSKDLAKR